MKKRNQKKSELGASLVEYGLLIALISLIAITAITVVGKNMKQKFDVTAVELDGSGVGCPVGQVCTILD